MFVSELNRLIMPQIWTDSWQMILELKIYNFAAKLTESYKNENKNNKNATKEEKIDCMNWGAGLGGTDRYGAYVIGWSIWDWSSARFRNNLNVKLHFFVFYSSSTGNDVSAHWQPHQILIERLLVRTWNFYINLLAKLFGSMVLFVLLLNKMPWPDERHGQGVERTEASVCDAVLWFGPISAIINDLRQPIK